VPKRVWCDAATGELLDGVPRFVMMNLEQFAMTDQRLTLVDVRVFGYLVTAMSKFGYVGATQAFMARKANLTQPQFNRALRRLKEWGYVEVVEHEGRRRLKVIKSKASKRGSGDFRIGSQEIS
jgi:DNA-binding MarR family transcriptional regulator